MTIEFPDFVVIVEPPLEFVVEVIQQPNFVVVVEEVIEHPVMTVEVPGLQGPRGRDGPKGEKGDPGSIDNLFEYALSNSELEQILK